MNIEIILIAVVFGFIAGVAGAVVAIEAKTEKLRKEISDTALAIIRLNKRIEELKTADNGTVIAIQELIKKMQRERAGIWDSINTLWKRFEKQNEAEPEQEEGSNDA